MLFRPKAGKKHTHAVKAKGREVAHPCLAGLSKQYTSAQRTSCHKYTVGICKHCSVNSETHSRTQVQEIRFDTCVGTNHWYTVTSMQVAKQLT